VSEHGAQAQNNPGGASCADSALRSLAAHR